MTRSKKFYLFASLFALGVALPASAQVSPAEPSGPQQTPAAPQAAPQDQDRDVVVVTANKREETIQDVPVAVTAITSEAKDELGIISVTDLTNVTPGLSYTPGNERVTLRGIGRQTNGFGADPGIANYNDGIYTAFAVFAGKDSLLIDRVEVLRGPQGTLYGRNSIGGAINTISKRPSDEFTADMTLGAGNFDAKKVGVAVSGPITDYLRYRLAGFRETREGIDPNYGSGETEGWEIDDTYLEAQLEGEIGDRFSWWLKAANLEYDKAGPPGGRTATFSTAPFITSGVFSVSTSFSPIASWAFSGNPSLLSFEQIGNRQDNPFATNREHAYNVNQAATAALPRYDEYIAEAVYAFDNFDLKYTGGYTFYDYELTTDLDGTSVNSLTYRAIAPSVAACNPLVGAPTSSATGAAAGCALASTTRTIGTDLINVYNESRSFFSNEINLISTNDAPLQWILGLYQYQENNNQPSTQLRLRNEPLASGPYQTDSGAIFPGGKPLLLSRNASLQNSYGAYGRGDYTLNDQWKVSLGLRYSYDIKDVSEEGFANCFIVCRGFAAAIPGGLTSFTTDLVNTTPLAFSGPEVVYAADGTATRRLKNQWSMVTGDVGAEYRPTGDTLLFAKYSKGYKAGAVNTGFAPDQVLATPNDADVYANSEKADVYEAGWKQDWVDLNLTTNTALFYYNYKDMQASVTQVLIDPISGLERNVGVLANIPEATSQGFELETSWNPVDPLTINFSYSWLDTEITDGGGEYINSSRDPRCVNNAPGGVTPVTCGTTPAGAPGPATTLVDPLRRVRLEGLELPQAPNNKVSLNVLYRFEFEDGSELIPTASYYWRDKFYDSIFNDANEQAPTQEQVDARLTWRSGDDHWTVIGWVRNLLDDEQNTSVASNAFRTADNGRYQTFSYAPPRMYGIDLQFHF
jgi:iron complex outermembrane recepter protein